MGHGLYGFPNTAHEIARKLPSIKNVTTGGFLGAKYEMRLTIASPKAERTVREIGHGPHHEVVLLL